MLKMAIVFAVNVVGYVLVYLSYHAAVKETPMRTAWSLAILVGTMIGSTLGERWFK